MTTVQGWWDSTTLAISSPCAAGNVFVAKKSTLPTKSQKWSFNPVHISVYDTNNDVGPPPATLLKRTYSNLFGPDGLDVPPANAPVKGFKRFKSNEQHLDPLAMFAVSKMNLETLHQLFNSLDKNGNGVLDGRDFDDTSRSISTRRARHARWEELRNYMDADRSGSIDREEFERGIKRRAIEESEKNPAAVYGDPTQAQMLENLSKNLNWHMATLMNQMVAHYVRA